MRLAIALALALVAQAPTTVPIQSVPVGELATLTASNAAPPLKWSIYQLVPVRTYSSNGTLVFTRPAGMYLVQLSAANGTSTWQIQFTPGNLPNPGPGPSPIPSTPTPAPPSPLQPGPTVDPSGFIYPPEMSGFSSAVSVALRKSPVYSLEDAVSLAKLYRHVAEQILIDGRRAKPGLKTLDQATGLVRLSETALLKGMTSGKLEALKGAFPEVAKVAAEQYAKSVDSSEPTLSDRTRTAYYDFLNALADGFDQAKAQ